MSNDFSTTEMQTLCGKGPRPTCSSFYTDAIVTLKYNSHYYLITQRNCRAQWTRNCTPVHILMVGIVHKILNLCFMWLQLRPVSDCALLQRRQREAGWDSKRNRHGGLPCSSHHIWGLWLFCENSIPSSLLKLTCFLWNHFQLCLKDASFLRRWVWHMTQTQQQGSERFYKWRPCF